MNECLETPLVFQCRGQNLFGILHSPTPAAKLGVLVVTGGPTYRVGPQRMNILLARELASAGIPVMRFDFRGTGDSDGERRTPRQGEDVHLDIKAALDLFCEKQSNLEGILIWGLCRGAIRTLQYAPHDSRVVGVVLLNPRVDSERIGATATLRHYYWQRITDPNFYRKVLGGDFSPWHSIKQLSTTVLAAIGISPKSDRSAPVTDGAVPEIADDFPVEESIEMGFRDFKGKSLMILGGGDLEAEKFRQVLNRSASLKQRIGDPDFIIEDIPGANHTFSTREWRDRAISLTKEWVTSF